MKKLLVVFAIATAFTACNDAAKTESTPVTDTAATTAPVTAPVDSAAKTVDSTIKAAVDTAAKTAVKVVDSAAKAVKSH